MRAWLACAVIAAAVLGFFVADTADPTPGSSSSHDTDPSLATRRADLSAGQTVVPTRFLTGPPRNVTGQVIRPAGRASVGPTFPEENLHSLAPATVSPSYASGLVLGHQVLIGDVALPWAYWLDPEVSVRMDDTVIHEAIAEWDGVPGSRWASTFAGQAAGAGVADGRSTIFLEGACNGRTTANTYLFTDGGLRIDRFGTTATQIHEADIGICPGVQDSPTLRRAVRHEVGHVLGLGHLCNPGDPCWTAEMGQGPHGCRIMFWRADPCQDTLSDADRLALATLYPRLRPLAADQTGDTLARASFAMFGDNTAPLAVVVAADVPSGVAPAAATLAARAGGTFLQAVADPSWCLSGSGAVEASRALDRRATLILVGEWPASCDRLAYDWDVVLRHVPARDPVEATLMLASPRLAALADSGASDVPRPTGVSRGGVTDVVVTSLGENDDSMGPDAAAAAALAGIYDVPLLSLPPGGPDPAALQWLTDHGVSKATVVGGGLDKAVIDSMQAAGVRTGLVAGNDRIQTGLEVAELMRNEGATGIVMTTADSGVEALAAAVVATHDDAAMVPTPPRVDARVTAWLDQLAPTHGWLVDTTAQRSPGLHAAYGASITTR